MRYLLRWWQARRDPYACRALALHALYQDYLAMRRERDHLRREVQTLRAQARERVGRS